jgi:hypothetical protein
VLQFYPTSDDQVQLITSIAQRAGFGGGIVLDYPNSKKARKVFLCLFVGDGGGAQVPQGLQGDEGAVESESAKATFEGRRQRESRRERNGKQKVAKAGRDWILKKKDVSCAREISCLFSLTRHSSDPILAVPETREGGRAARLQVHGSQEKGDILERGSIRPSRRLLYCSVLYFTLPARKRIFLFFFSIVAQPKALSLMLRHLLRRV